MNRALSSVYMGMDGVQYASHSEELPLKAMPKRLLQPWRAFWKNTDNNGIVRIF